MSAPTVVMYRYDASPYSIKVDHVLFLKNIPYKRVNVFSYMPRPVITDLLGLGYRRIPVLAIGNDLYCDSSLIASALERRFPASEGYGTIFPPYKTGGNPDSGIIKAFCRHYIDGFIFALAPSLIAWDKLPAAFIKDRAELRLGKTKVEPEVFSANRSKIISTLSSHLAYIEEQLQDGREWLFNTSIPGFIDVSVAFLYNWVQSLRTAAELFDTNKFPLTLQWLTRYSNHIKNLPNKKFEKISGDDGAKIISQEPYESYDVVGFDGIEAARLDLKLGDIVSVTSDETGKRYPTKGKLVALNTEELVIELKGAYGIIRTHFPRIGFTAVVDTPVKTML